MYNQGFVLLYKSLVPYSGFKQRNPNIESPHIHPIYQFKRGQYLIMLTCFGPFQGRVLLKFAMLLTVFF